MFMCVYMDHEQCTNLREECEIYMMNQDKTQTKRHDVSLIEEKRKFNGGIFCNLESSS